MICLSIYKLTSWERERERESYDIRVICVVHKCSTTDAPARSETTTTTTHDYANDGVPVGCPPPPNFWFIILITTRAQQRLFLPTDFSNLPPHAFSLNHRWLARKNTNTNSSWILLNTNFTNSHDQNKKKKKIALKT
jgi:hypothetical protein